MENMGLDHMGRKKKQTKKNRNHHAAIKQKGGKGVRTRNSKKVKKKKLLIKRVFDYLTSDSYMYAPLLAHDPAAAGSHSSFLPTAGPLDYIKRVTSRILTRPTTENDQQASGRGHQQAIGGDHPNNLLEQEDDKSVNVNQSEADFHNVGREQTIGYLEIVKRIVHQNDFLLSRPGHCADNPKDFIALKSSEELGCSA